MNKQDWALKLIGPHTLHDKKVGPVINFPRAVKLLKAEHARSVRICRQARMLKFHGLRDTDTNEWLDGYEAACCDILAALQRGRGGKG